MQIVQKDEITAEDKTNGRKPWIVTLVSMLVFVVGSIGLLLAIIAGVGALLLRVDLASFHVLAILVWYFAGPLLILAGYNLWKRKKWAAELAAAMIIFDLVIGTIRWHVDALVVDAISLVLIGLAWKHLR